MVPALAGSRLVATNMPAIIARAGTAARCNAPCGHAKMLTLAFGIDCT